MLAADYLMDDSCKCFFAFELRIGNTSVLPSSYIHIWVFNCFILICLFSGYV